MGIHVVRQRRAELDDRGSRTRRENHRMEASDADQQAARGYELLYPAWVPPMALGRGDEVQTKRCGEAIVLGAERQERRSEAGRTQPADQSCDLLDVSEGHGLEREFPQHDQGPGRDRLESVALVRWQA